MANFVSWLMNPIGNLLNLFNTSNDGGSSIWNHNNGYQGNSFTEQGNQNAGNFGLDPNGMVSGLWNDITGTTSQSREFSQQEYLQDKQNEYNRPVNQMARMKAAGINPNTAASGISQGGNESAQAPQVSSNVGGVAEGIGQAAGAVASMGAGAASVAAAGETKLLQGLKAEQIKANTIKELEEAGLNHWNAVSVATLLPIMDLNQQADFYLKLSQIDNTRAEYQNILAEHDRIMAQVGLLYKQGDLMSAEKAKIDEETRWTKAQNDFFDSHGYLPTSPLDVSMRNSIVTGRLDEAYKIGKASESFTFSSSYGEFKADLETIEERTEKELNGRIAYEQKLKRMEANKEFTLSMYDKVMEFMSSPVKSPEGLFKLILSIITTVQ